MELTGLKAKFGVEDFFIDAAQHAVPTSSGGTRQVYGLAKEFLSLALGGIVAGNTEFTGQLEVTGTFAPTAVDVSGTLNVQGLSTLVAVTATGPVSLTNSGIALTIANGSASIKTLAVVQALSVGGAFTGTTVSATGLISGSAGLVISSGATSLQAVTATTIDASATITAGTGLNVTTSGVTVTTGGLRVNAGTTAIQALTVTDITQTAGHTAALRAVSLAGNLTQSSGTAQLKALTVDSLLSGGVSTFKGTLAAEKAIVLNPKEDATTGADIDVTDKNFIIFTPSGARSINGSIVGGVNGQVIMLYNGSGSIVTIAAGLMVDGGALALDSKKSATVIYSSAAGKFWPNSKIVN